MYHAKSVNFGFKTCFRHMIYQKKGWLFISICEICVTLNSPVCRKSTSIAYYEAELTLILSDAIQHFTADFNKESASFNEINGNTLVKAIMNELATSIIDYCSANVDDFTHTVANHYRELLTNLPHVLKQRDIKIQEEIGKNIVLEVWFKFITFCSRLSKSFLLLRMRNSYC